MTQRSAVGGYWTLKPTKSHQIVACVLGAVVVTLMGSIAAMSLRNGGELAPALWVGGLGAILALWSTLFVVTLRVHVSAGRIWLVRFWHTRWSAERAHVELRPGWVGEREDHEGLRVVDLRTGEKVGEILNQAFYEADLARLREMFGTPADGQEPC